jgi:hypothetical protein
VKAANELTLVEHGDDIRWVHVLISVHTFSFIYDFVQIADTNTK